MGKSGGRGEERQQGRRTWGVRPIPDVDDRKPTVLVVDDEPDSAALTALVLTEAGYDCSSCTNAGSALTFMKDRRRDVVVTDVRMPGMDGVTVARQGLKQRADVAG